MQTSTAIGNGRLLSAIDVLRALLAYCGGNGSGGGKADQASGALATEMSAAQLHAALLAADMTAQPKAL